MKKDNLIESAKDVKSLIDYILTTKETIIEYVAVAIDETPADVLQWYTGEKWPPKKTLWRLCQLFSLICIEQHPYYKES